MASASSSSWGGGTCPNINNNNNNGLGTEGLTAARFQAVLWSLVDSLLHNTGDAVRWTVTLYLTVAAVLLAMFWLLSLIQYVRSIYRATIQGLTLSADPAIPLVVAPVWFLLSLLASILSASLWPIWLPLVAVALVMHVAWLCTLFLGRFSLAWMPSGLVWVVRQAKRRVMFWADQDSDFFAKEGVPQDTVIRQRVQKIGNSMIALEHACLDHKADDKPAPKKKKKAVEEWEPDLDAMDRLEQRLASQRVSYPGSDEEEEDKPKPRKKNKKKEKKTKEKRWEPNLESWDRLDAMIDQWHRDHPMTDAQRAVLAEEEGYLTAEEFMEMVRGERRDSGTEDSTTTTTTTSTSEAQSAASEKKS